MRLSLFVLLPLISLALSACGGGGSDDDGGGVGGGGSQPSVTPLYSLSYPSMSAYYEMNTAIPDQLPTTDASALTNFTVTPNLPGGLFLNSLNGKITGTPVGEWLPEEFTISAEAAGGVKVSGKFTLGVTQIGQTSVDPASTTPRNFSYDRVEVQAYTNENIAPLIPSYHGEVQAYFGYQSGLPNGLSINPTTGVISGAPQYPGETDIIVSTGDSLYAMYHYNTVVRVHIADPPLVGLKYTNMIYPSGSYLVVCPTLDRGNAPTYSVSPALPSGLSIGSSNGCIIGTPSATSAAQTYTVTATSTVNTITTSFTLEIGDYPPSNLRYTKNQPRYVQNIAIATNSPTNDGGAVSSYAISPALPTGLSFNTTTGAITGTPSALHASSHYTITATNASGSTTLTMPLAVVTPGTGVLYTGDGVNLKAYSVDDVNGDPTFLGHSLASTVTSLPVFHPTYNCMVGYSGSSVESYSVDRAQNGALTSVTSIGGVSSPAGIVESGDYIFVANNGFVSSYSINSSCALSFIANVSSVNSPRDMVMSGANIYVLNSGVVTQHFRHTGAGALTTTGSLGMQAHANPGVSGTILGDGLTLGISADGAYVYAFDSQRAYEIYAVNGSTGALSRAGVNVTGDRFYFRRGFVLGDYIYQNFQAQNDGLITFKMTAGGLNATSLLQGSSEVGNNFAGATRVTAHTSASGTYVFAEYSNISRTSCSRLKQDASTGALTPLDTCLTGILGGY